MHAAKNNFQKHLSQSSKVSAKESTWSSYQLIERGQNSVLTYIKCCISMKRSIIISTRSFEDIGNADAEIVASLMNISILR